MAIKETIYTIPVTEKVRENTECAFCAMHKSLEDNAIDFMLGASASYMEDHIRLATNVVGFCDRHYQLMFDTQNRLGLALIVQTHWEHVNKEFSKLTKEMAPGKVKKGLFARPASADDNKLVDFVDKLEKSCYVCDMINKTYSRYIETYFLLWSSEEEFRNLVKNGKGFCMKHFVVALNTAAKMLSAKEYEDFYNMLVPLQTENNKRIQDDIDWFTKKFDYRFTNEPWKDSKDAVQRTILKLSSATMKE